MRTYIARDLRQPTSVGHAILDVDEEFGISFGTNGNDLREVRGNAFASHYLLPPKFIEKLPAPKTWTEEQIVDWANKMKVSTWALSIALKESGLIDASEAAHMQQVRVPNELKTDPELGMNLSPKRQWNRSLPTGTVSPIEWDNVVLYGQYILDRKRVRQRRPRKKMAVLRSQLRERF
jgi:hypothetical protein